MLSGRSSSGAVVAVSTSPAKGMRKRPVPFALLVADHGIDGDAHSGAGPRQVSLLALESIEKMRAKGCDVSPGDFAENVTTEGVPVASLAVGDRLRIGENVLLEITQIGKKCHDRCAIFYQAGDCVMPREGIFARVVRGGEIRPGDEVKRDDPV